MTTLAIPALNTARAIQKEATPQAGRIAHLYEWVREVWHDMRHGVPPPPDDCWFNQS